MSTKDTGEKSFKCNDFDKSFPIKGTLNQHMFIHSGNKDFPCLICLKQFIKLSELN